MEWDGIARVDHLFVDYLGCPDDVYHRQMARLMLLGAVARVFEPGHKFDFVPILEGPQGIRKSSFIERTRPRLERRSLGRVPRRQAHGRADAGVVDHRDSRVAGLLQGRDHDAQGVHQRARRTRCACPTSARPASSRARASSSARPTRRSTCATTRTGAICRSSARRGRSTSSGWTTRCR